MTRLTTQYIEKYDEALHHLHQKPEIKQSSNNDKTSKLFRL